MLPLVHDDCDEQRCQHKVDAFARKRQYAAGHSAERTAENPVALVKERNEKVVVEPRIVRRGVAAKQRVGFVRQRKHQVRPPPRRAFVFVDHGDAIEQMPRVDHQRGHGCGQKRHAACEQIDRHILHGARVHGTRHQRRQPYRVAPRAQNNAEPEAQPKIAGKHRQGGHQGAADGFDALLLQKHRLPLRVGRLEKLFQKDDRRFQTCPVEICHIIRFLAAGCQLKIHKEKNSEKDLIFINGLCIIARQHGELSELVEGARLEIV